MKMCLIVMISLALMAFSGEQERQGPYVALPGNGTSKRAIVLPDNRHCQRLIALLWLQSLDPFIKEALLEKARNRGCLQ